MYNIDPFEDLVEYVKTLIDRENFSGEFALDRIKISHVTVLHNKEVPVPLYIQDYIP
jgi:hypothetical protein